MNLGIIFPLVIYLVFVFGAAIYAYVKRQRDGDFLSEYYVGNRSMTDFVLAMTTASTYASASSFIGGPGAAYKYGLLYSRARGTRSLFRAFYKRFPR